MKDLTSRSKAQTLKADFKAYLDGFSPNVQVILDKFKFRNQIDTMVDADILGAVIEKFTSSDINLSPNPIYKDVLIYYIKIEEAFSCCQMLRADAIINEYILKIMKVQTDDDLIKIRKDVVQQMKWSAQTEFTVIRRELEKLLALIDKKLLLMDLEEVRDWAEMKWKLGTQLTFNPVLVVLDDYAGDNELMKRNSSIYHLEILRRHLHTTLIINVQSLTSISTDIRRFTSEFVCFSTMSEADAELLKFRLPIKWNMKKIMEVFYRRSDAELFTTPGYQKLVEGIPQSVLKIQS